MSIEIKETDLVCEECGKQIPEQWQLFMTCECGCMDFIAKEWYDALSTTEKDFDEEVIPRQLQVDVCYYIDEETGLPIFDTDCMRDEFDYLMRELKALNEEYYEEDDE